jgi:membrane-associated phospholipid phosphatase
MSGRSSLSLFAWLLGLLRRLGWFYAAGLAIAIAALAGFANVADDALDGDIREMDIKVSRGLHAHSSPALDAIAQMLSHIGDVAGTILVSVLVVLILLRVRRPLDAASLVLVLLGGLAFSIVLKHSFRLPRPDLFPWVPPEEGYTFPSGHALMGVCLYGYLGAVLVLDDPSRRWRWALAAALAGLAGGIGWSRLYLGVHWLSDVLAGSLMSIFWVACCVLARRWFLARAAATRPGPMRSQPESPPE